MTKALLDEPAEAMIAKVARAIANCEWDQACSALGTPNHPRGGNWTAKLPQARAALLALRSSAPQEPDDASLREALSIADAALTAAGSYILGHDTQGGRRRILATINEAVDAGRVFLCKAPETGEEPC